LTTQLEKSTHKIFDFVSIDVARVIGKISVSILQQFKAPGSIRVLLVVEVINVFEVTIE
jgi:hypothetical protein